MFVLKPKFAVAGVFGDNVKLRAIFNMAPGFNA